MTLAALASAAVLAASPVCHGQLAPKPPDPHADLVHYAEQRAEFGFRHDLPYVRKLIKAGVWEYDVGYIPVTPAENRYLRLRDRLDLGAKAYRYLRQHPDLSGGVSIEDDWPRKPYLLVRLTRDVAVHTAALRALVPHPHLLRTRQVRYSERRLRRLADRIFRDDKRLARAGFYLGGAGTDIDANRTEIELITRRHDAARYFRRHYGPVKVLVIAKERTRLECQKSGTYEIAPDGRSLTVTWEGGGGARFATAEVREYPDRVEVGIVARVPNGFRTDELDYIKQAVALSAPLGDRAVIDTSTGLRMLQRGPSPGDPPCPPVERTPLDEAIAARAERHLRADPDYVRAILARGRGIYTRDETRWLERREKLMDQERLDDYLAKHADVDGGETIEGDYPAQPYVLVRLTRPLPGLAKHAKYPKQLRTVIVAHSEHELDALGDRIQKDADATQYFFDGYGRAGFYVRSIYTDVPTGTVTLNIVTTRADAETYFTQRYGPLVRPVVVGDRFECNPTGG